MHASITRAAVAVAAATALSALGTTGASASGSATHARAQAPRVTASSSAAVPGARLWVQRYTSHPRNSFDNFDEAQAVAVSPDGATVFVTGYRHAAHGATGAVARMSYLTIAYNAATGARLWHQRYNGPGNGNDAAQAIAVSPDGGTVFVTGYSAGGTTHMDYATIAYNATTGTRLWAQRYNGPGNGNDAAQAIAVSPRGGAVFVTGYSTGSDGAYHYATIAYDAATGARLWAQRYNGPFLVDEANSVAVSPDGATVFVTGQSGGTGGFDYATVAYNATTGAQLWLQRYHGPGNGSDSVANSVAVSPSGGTVFVTGYSSDVWYAIVTIAYNATTGAQLWVQQYNGPFSSYASSVAVSPDGATVVVTGESYIAAQQGPTYVTIAYNATTGAQLWLKRYNGPGSSNDASAVAISPDGATVYVTGQSLGPHGRNWDYATIAYNATTGAQQWLKRYNGPGHRTDEANSIAVSPAGDRVFVTGGSTGATTGMDYATIAYSS